MTSIAADQRMATAISEADWIKWGLIVTVLALVGSNLYAYSGAFTHVTDMQTEHSASIVSIEQHNVQVDTRLDTLNQSVLTLSLNVKQLQGAVEGHRFHTRSGN